MNTIVVAGSMVLVAIIGTLLLKYLDNQKEKRNMPNSE